MLRKVPEQYRPTRRKRLMFIQFRQRFGPIKRGLLAFGEDRDFAPDAYKVKLGVSDTEFARDIEVQLEAECATVQLRDAQFHELGQSLIETLVIDGFSKRE